MTDAPTKKSAGQSTRHALRVLRHLSQSSKVMSVVEISRELGIQQSIVHRACATLESVGFVDRIEHSAKFSAGRQGAYLMAAFLERFPIRQLSIPFLRRIVLETDQPAELYLRIGWYSVLIALVEPSRQDLPHKLLGQSALLCKTPEGRLLLDNWSADIVEKCAAFAAKQGCALSSADKAELERQQPPSNSISFDDTTSGQVSMMRLRDSSGDIAAVLKLTAPDDEHSFNRSKVLEETEKLQEIVSSGDAKSDRDALEQAPWNSIVLPNQI